MATLGFTRDDFGVFRIEDFSARMNEIYARIRPRLVRRIGAGDAVELAARANRCPWLATILPVKIGI